jgi:hypothetical protein
MTSRTRDRLILALVCFGAVFAAVAVIILFIL